MFDKWNRDGGKMLRRVLYVIFGVSYGSFGALCVIWNRMSPFIMSSRTQEILSRILRGIYFVLCRIVYWAFVILYRTNVILSKICFILWEVCLGILFWTCKISYKILYGILYLIYAILSRVSHKVWEYANSPFTLTFSKSSAEKLTDYFFDEESKKEKSLLARPFIHAFDFVSKRFLGSSLCMRILFLFLYFLLVLYLVVENYGWVLAPFARETSFADDYTILFRLTDRETNPVVHGVYSISWIYVAIVVWILCLNLSPERMLGHQYLFCLVAYFRSYFLAASSNVFLIIAIMTLRAAFYFNKSYVWVFSVTIIFCMVSLFLLDITVCFEDLGKDNIFRI